jgi:hypothetical protein
MALVGVRALSKRPDNWLLQMEGVPVYQALYSYYFTQSLLDAEKDKQGVPKDMKAVRQETKERCAQYIAVTSELRNMKIALDQDLKAQAAERTMHLWQAFGNYYESVGIDKPTVLQAQTGFAAKEQLFRALYGEDGKRETPEESIQSYFYGNYVAYEGVAVPYTVMESDGNMRKMTPVEKQNLITTMKALADEINTNDMDFLELAQEDIYAKALNYILPEPNVVGKNIDMPAEAFERIRAFDQKKITVMEQPEFVMVARGVNMRTDEGQFYHSYRDVCMKALRWPDYEKALKELYAAFRADENIAAVERLVGEWVF